MSGWGAWLSAGGVIAGLAGLAAVDAKRLRISWVFLGLLVACAAAWRISGHGPVAEALLQGLAGSAVGGAMSTVLIAWSKLRGGRTLLAGGDGLLLVAIGFLLGPVAISWALALGGVAVLVHRRCLQRKRGRSVWQGYVAFAPGMAMGAACAFVALNLDFFGGAAG